MTVYSDAYTVTVSDVAPLPDCINNDDCAGGSICSSGKCVCSSGYHWDGTACVEDGTPSMDMSIIAVVAGVIGLGLIMSMRG